MSLHRLAPWLLFIAIALIYLLFPTRVYYWDGITFAKTIEDVSSLQPSLVHPNHLIYNFVGYIFYKMLRSLGAEIRALTALQILNCLLSAVCARIFFSILLNTLRSLYLSVCLTLLFAFSATWWKFSTDADAYIPSVLFVLVSFYLVLPGQKARPLLLAVSFFISMAFHQLAVLMWPVLALGLYLQNGELSIKKRTFRTTYFSAVAAVLIIASYAYLFYLASGSSDPQRLLSWTASYSPDADTGFNLWSNLRYSMRGHVRLFFGGRLSLLKGLMNPLLVVMIAALAGTVVLVLVSWLRSLRTAVRVGRFPELRWEKPEKTVLLLALLWTFLYVVFLFFWLPQNTFYRLFYMPALILLLGLVLVAAQGRTAKSRTLAAFVLAVALANFVFMIYPFSLEGAPNSGFTTSSRHTSPKHQTEYSSASRSNSPYQEASLTNHSTPAR
ncbi:MAG TPA: hypothetical protein VK868_03085 [Pyrinomonadaceae bacterium]|nr:hypothetical protein [Pyrinomonadaceae bacterium]